MITARRNKDVSDYEVRVRNCGIEVMAGAIYPEDGLSINVSATGTLNLGQAREFVKAINLAIDLAEGVIQLENTTQPAPKSPQSPL